MTMFEDFQYLVVIEVQKVKSYVFASPAMREIRGASVLLDRLNRKAATAMLKNIPDDAYHTIYLGGGSGRVLFRSKADAESFCDKVIALYRSETVNARIAVEIVRRKTANASFSGMLKEGLERSRRRKTGRGEALSIVGGRWIMPCTSCGSPAAERMYMEFEAHRLCGACKRKRDEVNALYREIKPGDMKTRVLKSAEKLEEEGYSEDFIFTTLARQREKAKDGFQTLMPQDFNDIGAESLPANYMGFIYADGNAMGDMLRSISERFTSDRDAVLAQRAFSEIVDQATREAAVETILEVLPMKPVKISGENARFLPAELIMAGGDDLMMVVPSHYALDTAVAFLDKYQDKTRRLQNQYVEERKLRESFAACGLTASAGVVVAHTHYPVRHMMELAADLMKIAKNKAAKQEPGEKIGTLDFMVISDPGSNPMKQRREMEYGIGTNCRLTERPYTTTQAYKLLKIIRDLKASETPRSKLKALYASLFQSALQAQYDGLRIRERLKVSGKLEPDESLHDLFVDLNRFPFRCTVSGKEEIWSTPLSEIIEFYDYVHMEKKEEKEGQDG